MPGARSRGRGGRNACHRRGVVSLPLPVSIHANGGAGVATALCPWRCCWCGCRRSHPHDLESIVVAQQLEVGGGDLAAPRHAGVAIDARCHALLQEDANHMRRRDRARAGAGGGGWRINRERPVGHACAAIFARSSAFLRVVVAGPELSDRLPSELVEGVGHRQQDATPLQRVLVGRREPTRLIHTHQLQTRAREAGHRGTINEDAVWRVSGAGFGVHRLVLGKRKERGGGPGKESQPEKGPRVRSNAIRPDRREVSRGGSRSHPQVHRAAGCGLPPTTPTRTRG